MVRDTVIHEAALILPAVDKAPFFLFREFVHVHVVPCGCVDLADESGAFFGVVDPSGFLNKLNMIVHTCHSNVKFFFGNADASPDQVRFCT